MDWFGLDSIGLDWFGLDWIGLDLAPGVGFNLAPGVAGPLGPGVAGFKNSRETIREAKKPKESTQKPSGNVQLTLLHILHW